MDKMTIHRALSELKLIDAKIEKGITEIIPTGIYQKGKLINGHMKEEDFEASAKSKFDSVKDLIARKTKIKSAIVKANGETRVKIGEQEMTIADAITFKTVIVFKKQLIEVLKNRSSITVGNLNKNNEVVNGNVQKLLEATFGKDNTKVTIDDMNAVRKPYMEANEFFLFDPLDINKKVEELENEVAQFEAEVDAVLSEINAVTFIEV